MQNSDISSLSSVHVSSRHFTLNLQRDAMRRDATRRDATRRDATRRDATRRDATRRDATRRDATRRDAMHPPVIHTTFIQLGGGVRPVGSDQDATCLREPFWGEIGLRLIEGYQPVCVDLKNPQISVIYFMRVCGRHYC